MNIATHSFDALMEITSRPPTVFVRGEGSFLWDDSGKRYLDFIQGWAVIASAIRRRPLPMRLPRRRDCC